MMEPQVYQDAQAGGTSLLNYMSRARMTVPNEAEHSPATTPKPSTQPCYVCDGFGSRANEEAYMMMHTEPCTFCKGTGKLDMLGRALETPSKRPR